MSLEQLTQALKAGHAFSDKSIAFLQDKGLEEPDFERLVEALFYLREKTFAERRKNQSWMEKMLDRGDSEEITTGRYNRYVDAFKDISSEQAIVQGRMKFAVEYVIALSDLVAGKSKLVDKPFTDEEKRRLRSIYQNFRAVEYVAAKIIERKTNHDIVAANTWVSIRAQQLGLDDDLVRRITHFARTSADVNTNVTGELYMKAIGQWAASLTKLLGVLAEKATDTATMTCIGRTHGQDAQLTTLGHIYANWAEQIYLQAAQVLSDDFMLDGKIGGGIGTDVDFRASFPDVDPADMYRHLVEDVFGLNNVTLGNDQDCSNASLAQALDTMVNVGSVVKKIAMDTWLYASRGIFAKKTQKGESGSSVMPQKANPFFAEGAEALTDIVDGSINAIKKLIIAYREQGDLRRSITKREGFHPVMLSIIAINRVIGELNKYEPNIVAIEQEIYAAGPKVVSSAINTYLRAQGIPDAYDRIKDLVMRPWVNATDVTAYLDNLRDSGTISEDAAADIQQMLHSVMDVDNNIARLADPSQHDAVLTKLAHYNTAKHRSMVLGSAEEDTYTMIDNIKETRKSLLRIGGMEDGR